MSMSHAGGGGGSRYGGARRYGGAGGGGGGGGSKRNFGPSGANDVSVKRGRSDGYSGNGAAYSSGYGGNRW